MATTYRGCDWVAADSFINGGRNPTSFRKFNKTRVLHRVADGDIALRLHRTDVVIYHRDGTQTICLGGWNTRLTKDCINAHSAARVFGLGRSNKRIYDDETYEVAIYHESDPKAAPRVQKCRKCHGAGIVRHRCDGRGHVQGYREWRDTVFNALPGVTYDEIRKPYEWETEDRTLWGAKGWTDDGNISETHTRTRRDHHLAPCYHDMLEAHTWEDDCYRCKGTGRVDFGSHTVPYAFSSRDAVIVDATGRVIFDEEVEAGIRRAYIALRRRMRRPIAA